MEEIWSYLDNLITDKLMDGQSYSLSRYCDWKYLKIFWKSLFSDISQNSAPYKHYISYGKSFKKFGGGVVVVVVACLIMVSLQVLSF